SKFYGKNRHFSKIIVITTSTGKRSIEDGILIPGRISELENHLGLSNRSIPFTASDIVTLEDEKGVPLADIRTNIDNQLATQQIFDILKTVTDNDAARVTATVAGGRKTMSTTMAVAYQIFARQQDELIHLITHDSRFGNPEWYFPSDPNDETQHLDVSLVPVIKVGRFLGRDLTGSPPALMAQIQDSLLGIAQLETIKLIKSKLSIDGTEYSLKPRVAVITRFLLKRRIMSNCSTDCSGCDQCCISRSELVDAATSEMIDEYEQMSGSYSGHFERYKASRLSADQITLNNRVDEDVSRQISSISELDIPGQHRELLKIKKIYLEPLDRRAIWYGLILDKKSISLE
ncbi:MAG: TIGR02584 family CRISPR-associated protein, partial [Bacteroidetes bacterium]|nr:TIGR02584 family CRISPR-associated protein [Bacteroidota bacterium]